MTDLPDRRAFLKAAAATGALGAVGQAKAEVDDDLERNQTGGSAAFLL